MSVSKKDVISAFAGLNVCLSDVVLTGQSLMWESVSTNISYGF